MVLQAGPGPEEVTVEQLIEPLRRPVYICDYQEHWEACVFVSVRQRMSGDGQPFDYLQFWCCAAIPNQFNLISCS